MKRIIGIILLIMAFTLTLSGCSKNNNTADALDAAPWYTSSRIVGFYFYYPSGSLSDSDYLITKEGHNYIVTVNSMVKNPETTEISEQELEELNDILFDYGVYKWDGFSKTLPITLLTSANNRFTIRVIYENYATISAQGDHVFPEGYSDAENAILDFFRDIFAD